MRGMDPEARIRALLAAGDARGAATEAMRGFGPKIYGYLRAILRDDTDAADAFSLFGENLWRGISTFRGESSFRTWAYRVAWNAALAVKDEAWRRHGRRLETGEASRLADEIRTTAARVERQRTALEQLREELTPEEQTLLHLRIDQELPWDEIAQVLGRDGSPVESPALRKRFERLKERLASLARERGLFK
jgi:RNA polymerase sigma-70 factor (ECF subfamily)